MNFLVIVARQRNAHKTQKTSPRMQRSTPFRFKKYVRFPRPLLFRNAFCHFHRKSTCCETLMRQHCELLSMTITTVTIKIKLRLFRFVASCCITNPRQSATNRNKQSLSLKRLLFNHLKGRDVNCMVTLGHPDLTYIFNF